MTTSTIDKIKSERVQFENEVIELRSKNQLLSRKLKTANDPQGLIDQISRDKQSQVFLEENIVNLKGELSLREQKIEALTRELVIAHRSIEVQSKYENLTSTQSSVSNSREIMRTLYFDMGKKQADLHSVTLALADVTHRASALEDSLSQALHVKDDTLRENEKLAGNVEYLHRQFVEFNDELSHVRSELNHSRELESKLQMQLEMLTDEFATFRTRHDEDSNEKQLRIEELTSLVAIAEQEKESMRLALERANHSFLTKESIAAVREEQLQQEITTLQSANAQLTAKSAMCNQLHDDVEVLQRRLTDANSTKEQQDQRISELLKLLSEKELSLNEGTVAAMALDDNLMSVHAELNRVRQQLQLVTAERGEAVDALRQTMRATRDLSQKLHVEKDAREQVERTNQQLLQAKANMSAATLDALYQERRKSAALEKSLALVPLVLKWRSACVPGMDLPAATGQSTRAAAEEYARYYSSSSTGSAGSEHNGTAASCEQDGSVVQASKDINLLTENLSNIALNFETAAGLQEGVNATFDWLLNEDIGTDKGIAAVAAAAADVTKSESAEEQKSDVSQPNTHPPHADNAVPAPPSTPQAVAGPQPLSSFRSPGIAALMADAYQRVEQGSTAGTAASPPSAPEGTAPQSMVSELKR